MEQTKSFSLNNQLLATNRKFKSVKNVYRFNNSIFRIDEQTIGMFYRIYASDTHPWETEWKEKVFDGSGFTLLNNDYIVIYDTVLNNSRYCVDARGFLGLNNKIYTTFNTFHGNKTKISIAELQSFKKLKNKSILYPKVQDQVEKNWSHIVFRGKDQFIDTLSPTRITQNNTKEITTDRRNVFNKILEYYGKTKPEQTNYQDTNDSDIPKFNIVNFSLGTQSVLKDGTIIGVGHVKIFGGEKLKEPLNSFIKSLKKEIPNNHYKDLIYLMFIYILSPEGEIVKISSAFNFEDFAISFPMGIILNELLDTFDLSYGIDDRECYIHRNLRLDEFKWYSPLELQKPENYIFEKYQVYISPFNKLLFLNKKLME